MKKVIFLTKKQWIATTTTTNAAATTMPKKVGKKGHCGKLHAIKGSFHLLDLR